jgi:hypothetical protein
MLVLLRKVKQCTGGQLLLLALLLLLLLLGPIIPAQKATPASPETLYESWACCNAQHDTAYK